MESGKEQISHPAHSNIGVEGGVTQLREPSCFSACSAVNPFGCFLDGPLQITLE